MSEWQPISTAPLCDEVLLWFDAVVSSGGHIVLTPMYRIGRAVDFNNRRPAAWMPLPEAPRNSRIRAPQQSAVSQNSEGDA